MAYETYATPEYYKDIFNGSMIPADSQEKFLRQASHHIDSLTYNRIAGQGFLNLTNFQQETIKEICCEMADFAYDNEDMINSVLQSYAINGVSMSFGESWNLKVANGVAVRKDTYAKLQSTGLTSRILRQV